MTDAGSIGLIGAGNMSRAMALGWNVPLAVSDAGSGRATAIAALVGGVAGDNRQVAERSQIVFLCHKPAQLDSVAREIDGAAKVVVSVLGGVSLDRVRACYPHAEAVFRVMPNLPVEIAAGVTCVAPPVTDGDKLWRDPVVRILRRLGAVIEIDESRFEAATALGGCAPAFIARFAGHLAEAGVARGMATGEAALIVGETLIGTALLLRERGFDVAAVTGEVASPGGLTERALATFDANGLGATVDRAVAAVTGEEERR